MIFFLIVSLCIVRSCHKCKFLRVNKKLFIFKYFKNYADPKKIYLGGVLYVRGIQKSIIGIFTRLNFYLTSLGGKMGNPLHASCPSRFEMNILVYISIEWNVYKQRWDNFHQLFNSLVAIKAKTFRDISTKNKNLYNIL